MKFQQVFFSYLIVILTCGCSARTEHAENKMREPNIIYILADDLGYGDLSFTGQTKFATPNIDKLAADGMFFTQHYAGSTVCAPSRSALMTGQHTGHTFIRGNVSMDPEGQFPIASSIVTVAEILKQEGYVTGAFGKWGLGPPTSEGDPNNQGFDEFYGYNCQSLAHSYYPYHLWDNQRKIVLSENDGTQKNEYAPSLIHEKALAFLEKNKDTTFFMFYPSVIPHAELAAPEKYLAKYRSKFSPDKEYVGVDSGARYKNGGYGSQPETHATFAAMIDLLDEQVGDIRAKLEALGIANNTLIIFTSDNGPHDEGGADPDYFNSNGPFKGYKRDLYEGGIRIPMIAYWPDKIKAHATSDHVSAFWDFLPTVCDIAGRKPPTGLDGISYLPALLGEAQPEHEFLYWEFHERGGKQAVRWKNWKGIRTAMTNNPTAEIELYDLSKDKGEVDNVAMQHPDIVDELVQIMKAEHQPSPNFKFKFEQK